MQAGAAEQRGGGEGGPEEDGVDAEVLAEAGGDARDLAVGGRVRGRGVVGEVMGTWSSADARPHHWG